MPASKDSPVRISRRWLIGSATVAGLLGLWAVLTMVTGTIDTRRFPSPLQFWQSLKQIATTGYADGTLLSHALHSLKLVVMGFLVAVAIGIPLGLLMGWSRRAEALINPVFLLIRPIPPLAWIPLAILWLGLGDAAKIMVIFFAAFVPSVINTYTGVRSIEPHLIEAARACWAPGDWRLAREVLVPGVGADDLHRPAPIAAGRRGPRWWRRSWSARWRGWDACSTWRSRTSIPPW